MGLLFNRQYTIGDLMNIDANRQERANMCNVSLVKTFHELKRVTLFEKFKALFGNKSIVYGYYVIFKLNVVSDTGKSHIVFVRVDPDFNLQDWEKNKVQIYCDCADFKYRSAYKLQQHDSLFLTDRIKTSLGSSVVDSPKSKTKTTLLCKHSFAALNWIVSNYSSLMRTI